MMHRERTNDCYVRNYEREMLTYGFCVHNGLTQKSVVRLNMLKKEVILWDGYELVSYQLLSL